MQNSNEDQTTKQRRKDIAPFNDGDYDGWALGAMATLAESGLDDAITEQDPSIEGKCGRRRAVGLGLWQFWCLGPMLTSREAACDGRHRAWRAGSRETRRLGGLRQAASRGPSGPSEKKQCCAERS